MISCIMVTGMARGNKNLPQMAIDCFKAQTFKEKELIILNHGEERYADGSTNIREVIISKPNDIHIGHLRNMAWEYANGELLTTWDDDDHFHPTRLQQEFDAFKSGKMVLMPNWTFYDFETKESGVMLSEMGFAASMIFEKSTTQRFYNYARGSDDVFRRNFERVLIDNNPLHYIHFQHGGNINPASMKWLLKVRDLSKEENNELQKVVQSLIKT